MAEAHCPICGGDAESHSSDALGLGIYVECRVCGNYHVTDKVVRGLRGNQGPNRYILSGVIREAKEKGNDPPVLTTENIEQYWSPSRLPASKLDQLDLIMLYLAKRADLFGAYAEIDTKRDYPIAWAKSDFELENMLQALRDQGYIDLLSHNAKPHARLTIKGWQRTDELRTLRPGTGNQCFVAMSFTEELKPVYLEGIAPALEATGYKPVIMWQVEHNGKIDDRIVAEIRQSRLVVADFTEAECRGGVYFEAGFALGLGIPVVWCCREDYIDYVHFDTRQYNHVTWKDAADLRKKLEVRIRATHPLQQTGAA